MGTIGFNSVFDIALNGFTAMAALLALGLSVEYSVHVIHRFIVTECDGAASRIELSMEWLFWPTLAGFLTTAVSTLMLCFAEFEFVRLYYFGPLAIATLCTYFYGVFALPALLGFMVCFPALRTKTGGSGSQVDSEAGGIPAEDPSSPMATL